MEEEKELGIIQEEDKSPLRIESISTTTNATKQGIAENSYPDSPERVNTELTDTESKPVKKIKRRRKGKNIKVPPL